MSLDAHPRIPLLFGPSPVHRLERLREHLGGRVNLWAKRDDCNSGLAFGGNKTRKLEFLVADALAQGCDTLVSIGGVQSNHTRQVAAVAARLGLKAVLIQESWVEWPDVVYDRVGNIQLSRMMGADVRLVEAGFGIGFKSSWEAALAEVEEAGGKPYAIPAGASDHPLGGLGFASWAQEVAQQESALGVFFDTIVVCSVTGSSAWRRTLAAPRCGPSATTSTAGSHSAATRRASSSTSSPTRSPRAATRSSRSAACSPTTRARSRRWPPTRACARSWSRRAGSTGPTSSTTASATSSSAG